MMWQHLRTGLGTDLHRLVPGNRLWIGGVELESLWGCDAHSDGDALLHALIDALLGPCSLGDIGTLFPPSDAKWKGASSADLLALVLQSIYAKYPTFQILNVDAVVHLQAPKLAAHRDAIETRMAELLGIARDRVSLKAKTGEGLFPVGTHEAIETQVVLLALLETDALPSLSTGTTRS
jgi:2-C-methyl-D-erythritol 2,4-cyclodiphosphate synthase